MLSRLVITFIPKNKYLFISRLSHHLQWLWSPKIKAVTISIVFPSICHEVMGSDAMILVFWTLSFKPAFSLSFFTFIKWLFSFSSLSPIRRKPGFDHWVGKIPWRRERLPTPIFWPGDILASNILDCRIHGVAKSRTQLSNFLFHFHLHIWSYWYFSWQSGFQLTLHPTQHFTWYTLHVS